MEGFGLLIGHLVGDYIFQNDWQAKNKTSGHPGPEPGVGYLPDGSPIVAKESPSLMLDLQAWRERRAAWTRGHLACTVHCLLYTIAVFLCSFWWMPMWGLAVCFVLHWPIDRFRLAGRYMRNVSGQRDFATGVFSPWSIIVVDNVIHLATLFVIGVIAFKA